MNKHRFTQTQTNTKRQKKRAKTKIDSKTHGDTPTHSEYTKQTISQINRVSDVQDIRQNFKDKGRYMSVFDGVSGDNFC